MRICELREKEVINICTVSYTHLDVYKRQVIDRALEILTILSKETNGLSVSGLAKKLSLPPSSIHRILASLKENNFIIQDSESRKYKIGYKLYTLCSNMSKNNILVNLAKPIMQKLSEEIQMTVVLCVMEENHIINIACIESDEHSMYMVKIGKQMPLYSTSAGRVFSAYMDRCTVKEIYENMDLKPSTPYTKTKIQEFLEELDHIREKGHMFLYIVIINNNATINRVIPVSYTHLDVYKRQAIASAASFDLIIPSYLKYVFIVLSIFKLILLF